MVALRFNAAPVFVKIVAPLILLAFFMNAGVGEHRVDGLRGLTIVAKALVFVVQQEFAVLVVGSLLSLPCWSVPALRYCR